MQRRKSGAARKREFLEVALCLFSEQGYDGTTIQDIIDAVGVSKGTFYHYFGSKQDVVEELARDLTERMAPLIEEIAAEDVDTVEKLNRAINAVQEFKAEHIATRARMRRSLAGSGNLYLAQRVIDIMFETVADPFAALIAEGMREGVFDVPSAEEAAHYLLSMMLSLNRSLPPLQDAAALRRRVQFYEHALARVLGVQPGAIELLKPLLRRLNRERKHREEANQYCGDPDAWAL